MNWQKIYSMWENHVMANQVLGRLPGVKAISEFLLTQVVNKMILKRYKAQVYSTKIEIVLGDRYADQIIEVTEVINE